MIDDYREGWANKTWIFGLILRIFASRKALATLSHPELRQIVCAAVLKWSWSDYIMAGLAELVEAT